VKDIADTLTNKTTITGALPGMGSTMTFTDGTNDASVAFAAAPADVAAQVVVLNNDDDFNNHFVASTDDTGNLVVSSKTGKDVSGGTAATADATFGIAGNSGVRSGLSFTDATSAQSAITALDG
ncbi:hypothetical protein, partial [Couchioplanes caeruleus]